MYYCMDMEFVSESIIPDFGTIRMYYVGDAKMGYVGRNTNIKVRGYTLLSQDISKLNSITNAADGSQALVIDTGKTYILCDSQWREWTGNSGTSSTDITIKWNAI